MDRLPVSEVLPGLYRAVLDAVARLEARGRRRDAASIRDEAIAVYSRAWNPAAERKLRALRARADRIADQRRRGGHEAQNRRRQRAVTRERTTA
jgi:hypothetical protein